MLFAEFCAKSAVYVLYKLVLTQHVNNFLNMRPMAELNQKLACIICLNKIVVMSILIK